MPEDEDDAPETKLCPECGEEILAAAVRCKHCGAKLTRDWAREIILATVLVVGFIVAAVIYDRIMDDARDDGEKMADCIEADIFGTPDPDC
jgi:hypothetical protein